MACASRTYSSTIVGSLPNEVACDPRAKSYSATYWIVIATYWLSVAGATGLVGTTEAIGQGLCKGVARKGPKIICKQCRGQSADLQVLGLTTTDQYGSTGCKFSICYMLPFWPSGM
jgi:hypothetical protein